MTAEEFSNEFDVLLNSQSDTGIELDEYEKSIFLTEAQEQIVKGLYTGSYNGDTFESTEEMRRSLDSLIKMVRLDPAGKEGTLTSKSNLFVLPDDTWYIAYESVFISDDSAGCLDGKEIPVIPMTHDEYNRVSRNPFRGPSDRKAIRLDCGPLEVEIVSRYSISLYTVRYLSKPDPIVLGSFDGLTIDKESMDDHPVGCKLNSVIHRPILQRAVQLALSRLSRKGN